MNGEQTVQVAFDRDFLIKLLQRCHALEFLKLTRLQDIFENYAVVTDVHYDPENGLVRLDLYLLVTSLKDDISKSLCFCFGEGNDLISLKEHEAKQIKAIFTG